VESHGHLHVWANHWLRGCYRWALENSEIDVTRGGERLPYRSVCVIGAERERIARDYPIP